MSPETAIILYRLKYDLLLNNISLIYGIGCLKTLWRVGDKISFFAKNLLVNSKTLCVMKMKDKFTKWFILVNFLILCKILQNYDRYSLVEFLAVSWDVFANT
jgi:hypothetical protein